MLEVKQVSYAFDDRRILHNVNLRINAGQFVALVGPSGCGKSTLLRSILGTDPPSKGTILVDGVPVVGPSREVGIVYQKYSLYEFMTVEENVAFGLNLDNSSFPFRILHPLAWRRMRKAHLQKARSLLADLGLEHVFRAYPRQLSGGMQQRVAIAQALIMKPKILLLDEPFGALDEATREGLQEMLLCLYQRNLEDKKDGFRPPFTVVFVTHELNEAFYLADRVVGLSRGWKCRQSGVAGKDVGATICYDKVAPVFGPDDPRDFNRFAEDKTLLRRVVFEECEFRGGLEEHCTFWNDLRDGNGAGVSFMADGSS